MKQEYNNKYFLLALKELANGKYKIVENGFDVIWNEGVDIITNEVIEARAKEIEQEEIANKIKLEKKTKIEKIATLTDQLNLIAGILADQILSKAEGDRTDLENKALQVYKGIQSILNENNK